MDVMALIGKAAKTMGKAVAEEAGKSAAGAATDAQWFDALFAKASLALKKSFGDYLRNAKRDYNQVRTLATEPELRSMTGENGVYVSVGVNFGTASPSARGNKSTLTEIQVHCHG